MGEHLLWLPDSLSGKWKQYSEGKLTKSIRAQGSSITMQKSVKGKDAEGKRIILKSQEQVKDRGDQTFQCCT